MHEEVPAHYFRGLEHSLQQLYRQKLKLAKSPGIHAQAVTSTLALCFCIPGKQSLKTKRKHELHI